jgi:hypothetical protein
MIMKIVMIMKMVMIMDIFGLREIKKKIKNKLSF